MRHALSFLIVLICILSSYGLSQGRFYNSNDYKNNTSNIWDFSELKNASRGDVSFWVDSFKIFKRDDYDYKTWIITVGKEEIQIIYRHIGDSVYLDNLEINSDSVWLDFNSLLPNLGKTPFSKDFISLDIKKKKQRAEGTYSWQPDIKCRVIISPDYSASATMSVETIDFVLCKDHNTAETITYTEEECIPHYSIKTYCFMNEDYKDPVAFMRILNYYKNDSCISDTVSFRAREEWLTGIWKTVPKDIDVIPVNNEGFEFYLPGGCEAVEADVRVTAQAGTDYGTAHFNLMPAESYFMKVPGMTQGVYYIYVTVNDETFKNKRTIR